MGDGVIFYFVVGGEKGIMGLSVVRWRGRGLYGHGCFRALFGGGGYLGMRPWAKKL